MANTYGIPEKDYAAIVSRGRRCVFCRRLMRKGKSRKRWATTEHLDNNGPMDKKWNVVRCCLSCNSSKGSKSLRDWFASPYCRTNPISKSTVAYAVRAFIREHPRKAGYR